MKPSFPALAEQSAQSTKSRISLSLTGQAREGSAQAEGKGNGGKWRFRTGGITRRWKHPNKPNHSEGWCVVSVSCLERSHGEDGRGEGKGKQGR